MERAMEGEEETGAITSNIGGRHIKKKSLKNKALNVSFNEKDLKDFVTGFHKRKKKRRKEAQHLQQEALRRKRIELRAKRKLEREYVIFGDGGAPPDAEARPNENGEDDDEEDDEPEPLASVSGMTTYDNGDVKVLVRTSEISQEEESTENLQPAGPRLTTGSEKKHLVVKKKPFKKVAARRRSRPKQQTKRDKRKGNQKSKE